VSKLALDRALPEWRHIPCVVRSHITEQDNHPQGELRAHPPLPLFEPKPPWKNVCTGHDDDIESQKLSRNPEHRVYDGRLVIPLMDNVNFGSSSIGAVMTPKEALPKAKAAAIKALELDSALGEAYNSLAFVLDGFDWDLESGGVTKISIRLAEETSSRCGQLSFSREPTIDARQSPGLLLRACSTRARTSAPMLGSPVLYSRSETAVSSILLTATKGLAS
jgi:hypothetical protein